MSDLKMKKVAEDFENGDELSSFIKYWEFLTR
jgi:hypothetical protein